MYTFDQLKEDVRKEAEALRIHATKEERERLDIKDMNSESPKKCYYGLMTGSCTSPRAHALIARCCSVMVMNDEYDPVSKGIASIITHKPVSKGYMRQIRKEDDYSCHLKYISAIEAYILLPEANNANLIAYLRGETETLTL